MTGFLDTNIVVRYLTGHPPEMASVATRIIDGPSDLMVTDVVLTETAHVLRSRYELSRETIVDHLILLLSKRNISTYALDKSLVIQGLAMCRPSGRIAIFDSMIWAAARTSGANVIYSFDRRFPSEGVEIRQSL